MVLYILEIKPLLHHLQIFSPILKVVVSIFFNGSLRLQKLLHLIRSHLFLFLLLSSWETQYCTVLITIAL